MAASHRSERDVASFGKGRGSMNQACFDAANGDPLVALGSGRRWSVLLKGYTGPAPYGEFYRDHVSSVGVGIGFTL